MKYLKKFESNYTNKYKEGDYVFIKTMDKYEPYCKIKEAMDDYDPEVDIKQIQYTAEIFNKDEKEFEDDFIEDSMIIRKMTKDEIAIFHQLKTLYKFNI